MSGRRLFFALWPDEGVRRALARWQRQHLPPDVRPTHVADLHLTLHFLGQVEEDCVEPLLALGRRQRVGAFELVLDRVGWWSGPRVFWVAPGEVPAALARMHEAVGQELEALDFTLDPRPFAPHVTLARKVRGMPDGLTFRPLRWFVKEWALLESRAGERPLYHPLARWPLQVPADSGPV